MVSALVSGSSGLGSNPGGGHCVVLLDSASLNPGVQMGTSKFNARGNPAIDYCSITSRGSRTFLVASCSRKQAKLWPDGPLGFVCIY